MTSAVFRQSSRHGAAVAVEGAGFVDTTNQRIVLLANLPFALVGGVLAVFLTGGLLSLLPTLALRFGGFKPRTAN